MSGYDPTDIQAQAQAQADTDLRAKLARETEEADLLRLMQAQWGRRIAWRLLDRAGVFRLSFSSDPMQMAFAEGNRNAGLGLLAMIHAICPDLYITMAKEANEQRDPDDGSGGHDR